jgi:hypothetical protein
VKSKIQKFCIGKQVKMMWRKHSHIVLNALIYNARILSQKACDATLGKSNRSFLAFSNIIWTLLIRTIDTPNERLRKNH